MRSLLGVIWCEVFSLLLLLLLGFVIRLCVKMYMLGYVIRLR